MKKTNLSLLIIAALLLVTLACQVDFSSIDEDEVAKSVAKTLEAQIPPTQQPQPEPPQPAPTAEPVDQNCCGDYSYHDYDCDHYNDHYYYNYCNTACNKARFISETVRDYSVFYPNESFTKIWRIKNIGHCTWTTDYRLALQSGNSMGVRHAEYFPHEVRPGEYVDLVLDMNAPYRRGEYTSFWQLQDEYGRKFGQVYLIIDVR